MERNWPAVGGAYTPVEAFPLGALPFDPGGFPASRDNGNPASDIWFCVSIRSEGSMGRTVCATKDAAIDSHAVHVKKTLIMALPFPV
jgi:hypothetical protein